MFRGVARVSEREEDVVIVACLGARVRTFAKTRLFINALLLKLDKVVDELVSVPCYLGFGVPVLDHILNAAEGYFPV